MSKHTPGPWHVVNGGRHWNNPTITNYRIHAPPGERGFDVAWSPIGELVVEHVYEEADARLIAAAPELLDALLKLVDSCDDSDGAQYGTLSTYFVRSIATAAIAKATGGAA